MSNVLMQYLVTSAFGKVVLQERNKGPIKTRLDFPGTYFLRAMVYDIP